MSSPSIDEHAATLRNAFCDFGTRSILTPITAQATEQERKQALSADSGIVDEALLGRLMTLGIEADTLAAVSLVPLIEVAWSDGHLHEKEQIAILEAAKQSGLRQNAYDLLKHWLQQKPADELLNAWKVYVAALSKSAGAEVREKLKADVLGRARRVAEAAGGILRIGSISASEKAVLDSLEDAFA
jgi:plasmid stability protein